MSLGLFNCRLIQTAGDQLFFLSAILPHGCQFGRTLFSLYDASLGPDQREDAERFFVFLLRKVLSGLSAGSPDGRRRSTPADSPANLPNPTHRFCYRAEKENPAPAH